jgi:WD40 repeat protein
MRALIRPIAALIFLPMLCGSLFLLIRFEIVRLRVAQPTQAELGNPHAADRTPLGPFQVVDFALLSNPSRVVAVGRTGVQPDNHPLMRVVGTGSGRLLFESRQDRDHGVCATIAVSPDERAIAVAGYIDGRTLDGFIQVFETNSYKMLWEGAVGWGVSSLTWSHDGSRLAAGNMYNGTVTVWDRDGRNQRVAWRPRRLGEGGSVTGLAWSRDGRRIASASSGTLSVWSVEDGRELGVFLANSHFRGSPAEQGRNEALVDMGYGGVRQFHFAPDDRSLLVNSQVNQPHPNTGSSAVWTWDLVESRVSMKYLSTSNLVLDASFHVGSGVLHTASLLRESDGLIRTNKRSGRDSVAVETWSLEDGRRVRSVTIDIAETTIYRGVRISADGRRLALAVGEPGQSQAIEMYDIPQAP